MQCPQSPLERASSNRYVLTYLRTAGICCSKRGSSSPDLSSRCVTAASTFIPATLERLPRMFCFHYASGASQLAVSSSACLCFFAFDSPRFFFIFFIFLLRVRRTVLEACDRRPRDEIHRRPRRRLLHGDSLSMTETIPQTGFVTL